MRGTHVSRRRTRAGACPRRPTVLSLPGSDSAIRYPRSVPSEKRDGVQSLSRALDLLEALAATDESALTDLAQRTGMIPSTAHRLLASLAQRGYVAQSPGNGRYRLGFKALELASSVSSRRDHLRTTARPHLEALREQTGESVNLVVLDRLDVVYLDQVEGSRSVRMFTQVGRTVPAHTTGAGKAILAHRPADEVERLYADDAVFAPLTPRTITNAVDLDRALESVSAATASPSTTRSTRRASAASPARSSTRRIWRSPRSASPARPRGSSPARRPSSATPSSATPPRSPRRCGPRTAAPPTEPTRATTVAIGVTPVAGPPVRTGHGCAVVLTARGRWRRARRRPAG